MIALTAGIGVNLAQAALDGQSDDVGLASQLFIRYHALDTGWNTGFATPALLAAVQVAPGIAHLGSVNIREVAVPLGAPLGAANP